jgi:hypothetical protein
MREKLKETDLARPLYEYLGSQGYTVRSEVKDCDIAAVRGDELLVIEIKKTLNLALLAQAAKRQRITESVYMAVPRPPSTWKWHTENRWVKHVIRRLELGLIFVSLDPAKPAVDVVFHPGSFTRRKRAVHRRVLLEEMKNRTGDFNTAGSTGKKLVTAYRENAIFIACCLKEKGTLSPKALREMGTGQKTLGVLYQNVYGWFERRGTGKYGLSVHGEKDLAAYPKLAKKYTAKARKGQKK